MYKGNHTLKASGAISVATPGELAGFYESWKLYGRLPWSKLVLPAARLAEEFVVSPMLYHQMREIRKDLRADPGLSSIYMRRGRLLRTGEICRNLPLASTLRLLAREGVRVFYNGSLGRDLVEDVQNAGGILQMVDLKKYQVKIREPITLDFMGLKLFTMPPPSSGGASMALILNILAQYGPPLNVPKPLQVHREIESMKHAFAERMNLGDPDFVNITQVVSDMLSPDFAAKLKERIYDNMTFNSSDYYGDKWRPITDHGTSHLSVIDSERNAVAMTCTINNHFGSRFLSPSTGIVLNNQMDDFSIPGNTGDLEPPSDDYEFGNATTGPIPPPAPSNFIRPFKRPLSSMTPTIILEDGNLRGVIGASGGPKIIGATTQVLLNYFAKGMGPLASIFAPRYYHQLIPNILEFEEWTTVIGDHIELPQDIRIELEKRGHALRGLSNGAIVQLAIQEPRLSASNKGELVAVSDPRKGGTPAGY